ncbi:MAG: heavy-metal-associated domain-containing protein [Planctomycetota bacterium]|nr:heavy-metal-associated domain-containing protein [Planctomycetota bacterium]
MFTLFLSSTRATASRPAALIFTGLLFATSLGAVGGLAGCASAPAYEEKPVTHAATEADLAYVHDTTPIQSDGAILYVNGMGCPLCATNVDIQLKRLRGVQSADVNLDTGRIVVNFKPDGPRPSPKQLADAVEDSGFTLVRVEPQAQRADAAKEPALATEAAR